MTIGASILDRSRYNLSILRVETNEYPICDPLIVLIYHHTPNGRNANMYIRAFKKNWYAPRATSTDSDSVIY